MQERSPLSSQNFNYIFRELFTAALGIVGIYVSARVLKRVLDPTAESRKRLRGRRDAVLGRLKQAGVPHGALVGMSDGEEALLYDIVFPEDITSNFKSIGGLGGVKEAVRELIVDPLVYPELFKTSNLLSPPKGVLLYGPPGTGKTMMAKALAKESGAIFLNLSPSSLLSKWLGETEQMARAVFTLARRVAPTIIFIDEIDGLFRERSSSEHEAHKNLKAEFMQLWDGLTTDEAANIVVLGATNRPYDVDPAILRRMPRSFEVGLPNVYERMAILKAVLHKAPLESDFSYRQVATVTDGYSGSDLKELCRAAMMQPAREAMRRMRNDTADDNSKIRPLTVADVLRARREVIRTEVQSADYRQRSGATNSSELQIEPFMRQLLQPTVHRAN